MISAHSLTRRLRRSHRRPSQRRSHHNDELRPPMRHAGRGAFFASCPDDGLEEVVVIPERPRILWPAEPPEGYRGQLEEPFQRRLAAERAMIEREDCRFVQTSLMASGDAVEGEWDLRGGEVPYLGATDFSRATVLELAPANGYFTFHMERLGAEVVAFDIGWDRLPEVMPEPGDGGHPRIVPSGTVTFHAHAEMRSLAGVQNGWWYLHRDYRSRAKMVYGDPYHLPVDIGVFDVALVAGVLPRMRDPWEVLSQVAACTRQRIVVTDPVDPAVAELSTSAMEHACLYAPGGPSVRTAWWSMSPGAVADALRHLGFGRTRLLFHSQRRKQDADWSEVPMFTVVAEREWAF